MTIDNLFKKTILAGAVSLMAACGGETKDTPTGCTTDNDCNSGRVCNYDSGRCETMDDPTPVDDCKVRSSDSCEDFTGVYEISESTCNLSYDAVMFTKAYTAASCITSNRGDAGPTPSDKQCCTDVAKIASPMNLDGRECLFQRGIGDNTSGNYIASPNGAHEFILCEPGRVKMYGSGRSCEATLTRFSVTEYPGIDCME